MEREIRITEPSRRRPHNEKLPLTRRVEVEYDLESEKIAPGATGEVYIYPAMLFLCEYMYVPPEVAQSFSVILERRPVLADGTSLEQQALDEEQCYALPEVKATKIVSKVPLAIMPLGLRLVITACNTGSASMAFKARVSGTVIE